MAGRCRCLPRTRRQESKSAPALGMLRQWESTVRVEGCRGDLSVLLVRPGDQAGRPLPALWGRSATVGRAPGRHRAFDRGDEGARRRHRPRAAADRRQDAGRALPAGHPRPRRRGTAQAGHPATPGAAPPSRPAATDRHHGRRRPGCPARALRAAPRRTRRRPRPGPTWLDADDPEHPPEASSREVQNIPLGLGALLLGVAAVVFAAVATSSMDALARLGILLLATVLMLLAPPALARRGLTSTAETIAAVGLLLVPLAGNALWAVDRIGAGGGSATVFAGVIFAVTAAVAFGYAGWTGLRAPRFATVLAAQPVLPLLAYDRITGPGGWALVLALVALVDLWPGPLRRDRRTPRPAGPAGSPGTPSAPRQRDAREPAGGRPGGGRRADRRQRGLRRPPAGPPGARPAELTWLLHARGGRRRAGVRGHRPAAGADRADRDRRRGGAAAGRRWSGWPARWCCAARRCPTSRPASSPWP